MANATLSFSLPEEQVEFDMACKAADMHIILSGLDNELRSHLKYSSRPEWHSETVEEIRRLLNDMRAERCIHFN